jgi:hypothetical protein
VTTILVTDATTWRVLGSDQQSRALARHAQETFTTGDEAAALAALCDQVSSYIRVERAHDPGPLPEVVARLRAASGLPLCDPALA